LRVTGLAHSLRRSTTAAAFVVAVVVSLSPVPALAASGLSNGTVSPGSGTLTTQFTFTVDYEHPNRDAETVTAYLDGGHPIDLSLVAGGSTLHGTWTATQPVPAGTWTVTFEAVSANGTTWPGAATPATINVVGPTPVPTPTPRATPRPTPRPTAAPTPRPTVTPTLPPGATPRPPGVTPQPATPGTGGTVATPGAAGEGGSVLPSATAGTLAGNPSPGSSEGGGNVPASGSGDPSAEATSDTESGTGVGRVVMLAVGGTLAVSGAGYLALLTMRRRGRMNGGPN
jgi:hypothetical protein